MKSRTIFVGIDAHKDTLVVAVLQPNSEAVEFTVANRADHVARLTRRLAKIADGREVRAAYEAGPTGYALQRQLVGADIICEVVAPSLIPTKPGDRVKTDRRDARKLAELLRAGMLTEVHPPTPEEESIRDLCRLRLKAKEDQTRVRNRIGKFLLRHGHSYLGKTTWTAAHRAWLQKLSFEYEATRLVFADLLRQHEQLEDRVSALDDHISRYAATAPYDAAVRALCCLRGFRTLTAMVVLSELFCFTRFESPRALMAYLGLTPSQQSSGRKVRMGGITKTGNRFVRRVLVEAAKHARRPPKQSRVLRDRRRGQSPEVLAIAERAQHRLHRRYWRLSAAGKHPNVATVAVTRELAGFLWGMLRLTEFGSRSRAVNV